MREAKKSGEVSRKGSVEADELVAQRDLLYAVICGETLARAHARSGDRVAIAAYLGLSDRFDQAISEFADAYADQNQRDYDAFVEAVGTRRLRAEEIPQPSSAGTPKIELVESSESRSATTRGPAGDPPADTTSLNLPRSASVSRGALADRGEQVRDWTARDGQHTHR